MLRLTLTYDWWSCKSSSLDMPIKNRHKRCQWLLLCPATRFSSCARFTFLWLLYAPYNSILPFHSPFRTLCPKPTLLIFPLKHSLCHSSYGSSSGCSRRLGACGVDVLHLDHLMLPPRLWSFSKLDIAAPSSSEPQNNLSHSLLFSKQVLFNSSRAC